MRLHRLSRNIALGLVAGAAALLQPSTTHAEIKLGIEDFRSTAETKAQWQPLADYLQAKLSEPVIMIPTTIDQIPGSIETHSVDFMITNPLLAARVYAAYSARPIASLVRPWGPRFGGVIFSTAKSGLRTAADIKGKKLALMPITAAGAYLFQADYLRQKGIDVPKDFSETKLFLKQENIVLSVQAGLYDVGFVRTGFLEDMVKRGKIQMSDFTVIDAVSADNSFPFVRTTALYPEWYVMVPKETDAGKTAKMKPALSALAKDSPDTATAISAKGFDEPLPIEGMVELLKALHLPPFDK